MFRVPCLFFTGFFNVSRFRAYFLLDSRMFRASQPSMHPGGIDLQCSWLQEYARPLRYRGLLILGLEILGLGMVFRDVPGEFP